MPPRFGFQTHAWSVQTFAAGFPKRARFVSAKSCPYSSGWAPPATMYSTPVSLKLPLFRFS